MSCMKYNECSTIYLQVANPFLVLNEDISETFGRLLFDWEMPPKKLEGFAQQANIKLIKIVAQRCGVSVPSSKRVNMKAEEKMLFKGSTVLNNSNNNNQNNRNNNISNNNNNKSVVCPFTLVENILSEVKTMRDGELFLNMDFTDFTYPWLHMKLGMDLFRHENT